MFFGLNLGVVADCLEVACHLEVQMEDSASYLLAVAPCLTVVAYCFLGVAFLEAYGCDELLLPIGISLLVLVLPLQLLTLCPNL